MRISRESDVAVLQLAGDVGSLPPPGSSERVLDGSFWTCRCMLGTGRKSIACPRGHRASEWREPCCFGTGPLAFLSSPIRALLVTRPGNICFPTGDWCSPFAHAKEKHRGLEVRCRLPPSWWLGPLAAMRRPCEEASRPVRRPGLTSRDGAPNRMPCGMTWRWTKTNGSRSFASWIRQA